MKAIRVHAPGGPEVLRYEDVPEPAPKPGEALVRVEAAGVNFIDVYYRSGQYRAAFPITLGQEGAGVVEALGPDAGDEIRSGHRVAWAGVFGAYAEKAAVPANRLVRLPDGLSTRDGAAAMLQGMTAHYLACSTYPLKESDVCLVHAAAGGVGRLLCQIAKIRSARVLGTVSTAEKAEIAREAGADLTIDYTTQDFQKEARHATAGRGVDVVYDSVGKNTFEKSLDSLAPRGMLVLFGQSSGAVAPLDPQVLSQKGSLYLTRPTLAHYVASRADLTSRAGALWDWISKGQLRLRIAREFALRDAAEAHRALEGRTTSGKILLLP